MIGDELEPMREQERGEFGVKTKKGGGANNRIAYGILMGHGINTEGMDPSTAWELVAELGLMERNRFKATEEDQKGIDERNEGMKAQGVTKETVIAEAKTISNQVDLHGSNIYSLNAAVSMASEIMKENNLNKLKTVATVKMAVGTLARASGGSLSINPLIVKNPAAAYRHAVEEYAENVKKTQVGENRYNRHNVIYKGQEIESVVAHEMGHVIADQCCGQINGSIYLKSQSTGNRAEEKRRLIEKTYTLAKSSGEIYEISEYANKDSNEFFAEVYAMHKMKQEKLPQYIENMIKEVIS